MQATPPDTVRPSGSAPQARSASRRSSPAPLQDIVRATEIVRILVAHGFGFVVEGTPLSALGIAADAADASVKHLPLAERVRRVLEALGPTFVKLGQVLSTRADVVPDELVAALRSLQDRAQPLPYAVVKQVVEQELGRPLAETFEWFAEEALATASIAQVHRARIVREGQSVEVVVKVQRPGIHQTMRSDLSLLFWLGRALEGVIEEVSAYSPTAIVEQFEEAVEQELDFIHERKNLERARRNFGDRPDLLVVPESFPELSTSRVLTMAFIDGIKVTDTKDDPRYDKLALRDRLVEIAFKQVFEDGAFHGDPHPGNVLVLRDGRIGMIDHGLWGHLTADQQDIILHWLTAIALKSPRTLARLTLKVGQVPSGFDRAGYERDVRGLMDKYVGKELNQLDASSIIADSIEVVRRHRIQLPPDFAVLARATATLEGVIRALFPDLDFQALILPYVQKLIWRRFDPTRMGPEAMSLLLGVQDFVNEVPAQIEQLLADLSAGRFRVGLHGEAIDGLNMAARIHGIRVTLSIISAALILAAAVMLAPFSERLAIYGVPVMPILLVLACMGVLTGLGLTFVFPSGLKKIRLSSFMFWKRD